MDVNIIQLLGLSELFEEDDKLFEVADILDSVTLPPMRNPWFVPPPVVMEQPAGVRRRKGLPKALALALNIFIYVVCATVIAVSLILRFSGYNSSVFGYHIYHVDSGSMTPAADGSSPPGGFRENDAIIVKNAVPETVAEGDIITYWQDDSHRGIPITHRVMEIQDQGGNNISFVTKGDDNAQEDDGEVPGSRLIGVKVFTLPKLGGALKAAREHPWISVGVSVGVMAVVFTMYIVTARRAGKREEQEQLCLEGRNRERAAYQPAATQFSSTPAPYFL